MAARATVSRKVVSVTIAFLASTGMSMILFKPTMAIKPKTNHGMGGLAALAEALLAKNRVLTLRAKTAGASSMTRASLLIVPISPERWPFWKDAATTCAISWIDTPLQRP